MTNASVFKTPESREKIRARYAEILAAFPFRQRYVDTAFGRTFALEAGAPDAPAAVLLHGSCSNSAFWFPEILALSGAFRVLAVDILGEAGNTDGERPDLRSGAYADWLAQALDALGAREAMVAGNSLGGWVALRFAAAYPGRVRKLALIAAAGLAPVRPEFLQRTNDSGTSGETPQMDASVTGGAALPPEVEEFIRLILWGYNPIREELPPLTDAQLARITIPVLFVAGREDNLIDTAASAQRLREYVPGARVRLLENTGHMVPDTVEHLLPFFMEG